MRDDGGHDVSFRELKASHYFAVSASVGKSVCVVVRFDAPEIAERSNEKQNIFTRLR
jgi:hypothetical protein